MIQNNRSKNPWILKFLKVNVLNVIILFYIFMKLGIDRSWLSVMFWHWNFIHDQRNFFLFYNQNLKLKKNLYSWLWNLKLDTFSILRSFFLFFISSMPRLGFSSGGWNVALELEEVEAAALSFRFVATPVGASSPVYSFVLPRLKTK